MAKDDPGIRKSEKIQLAKISALQAIIVALIAAVATAIPVYFAGRQSGRDTKPADPTQTPITTGNKTGGLPATTEETANQSAQLIDSADLPKLIKAAQFRVFASGYVLDPIDPQVLAEKMREKKGNFQVKIVLVNPSSPIVCQRDADGGSKTPGYEKLTNQIKRFNRYREGLSKENYKVQLSNRYPMMAVYIIDNDVYAHFYPYAASGLDSPVLKLNQKDKNAAFFMNHFNLIFDDSQSLPFDVEYKLENPCGA